ncbi:hypothetical protein SLEP1_g32413 [Rubroshorea leprosula]|uniref:Uncharacterized protein n=1 Tax=Rubroshorea leprosula TaxID=152421 RepID=A0AAV5KDA0_9ROSI|nr:hypothetical protein SLEP1_g32413 [Rubroshorea leprosula]
MGGILQRRLEERDEGKSCSSCTFCFCCCAEPRFPAAAPALLCAPCLPRTSLAPAPETCSAPVLHLCAQISCTLRQLTPAIIPLCTPAITGNHTPLCTEPVPFSLRPTVGNHTPFTPRLTALHRACTLALCAPIPHLCTPTRYSHAPASPIEKTAIPGKISIISD